MGSGVLELEANISLKRDWFPAAVARQAGCHHAGVVVEERPRQWPFTTLIAAALLALAAVEVIVIMVLAAPLWSVLPLTDGDYRAFNVVTAITFSAAGFAIVRRKPRNLTGWLFLAGGTGNGLYGAGLSLVVYELAIRHAVFPAAAVLTLVGVAWMPLPAALAFTLALFPDGRPLTTRWRAIPYVLAAGFAFWALGAVISQPDTSGAPPPLAGLRNPFALPFGEWLATAGLGLVVLGVGGAVVSLLIRVRRSNGIERQQLKWLGLAAIPIFISFGDFFVGANVYISSIAVALLALPVSVAILGYRLYDLDLFVNRALVYGALSAIVIAIYVAIVAGAAFVSASRLSLPPVLAAMAAALLAIPLRDRLQLLVDRLMYGKRREPLSVIKALGRQLESAGPPEEVLRRAVAELADVLRLDGLMVESAEGAIVASFGSATGSEIRIPLVQQGELVGDLAVSPRSGERLSPRDLSVLEDLGPQLAIALHALNLTDEVRRSRERIVLAREEERRRIRRDLHDGLGPTLTGVAMLADAARNQLKNDPKATAELLSRLRSELTAAISEIRKLVYGLRPPALDEFGLTGALRQQAERFNDAHRNGNSLTVYVEESAEMPDLPAAVEVAAYRITAEALNNVSRHSGANHCEVRLTAGVQLEVEVVDNGRGWPVGARSGVGLASMRERAEELGGRLVIEAAPGGGTRVLATLPLRANT